MTPVGAPGLAVVGAEHLHLFEIVDALAAAGARTVAHVPGGSLIELYTGWRTESVACSLDEVMDRDDIDIVVAAGVPSERAEVAIAAIGAGKAVVSAKPGVTSEDHLRRLRGALEGRTGRPWTVVFTERFGNTAVIEAIRMTRAGAIGEVVRIDGTGPHTLAAEARPGWFWDPVQSGGILVDLASHQVDEFLALTGDPANVEVVAASMGNVACGDHPGFCDVGSLTLRAPGVQGHHTVDMLSPSGLDTWGDVRLSVIGTEGTLEVRANIDVTGEPGAPHLIHVDGDGARRVDLSGVTVDWASTVLVDLADQGERLMSQEHVVRVAELTLTAQQMATSWGSSSG